MRSARTSPYFEQCHYYVLDLLPDTYDTHQAASDAKLADNLKNQMTYQERYALGKADS